VTTSADPPRTKGEPAFFFFDQVPLFFASRVRRSKESTFFKSDFLPPLDIYILILCVVEETDGGSLYPPLLISKSLLSLFPFLGSVVERRVGFPFRSHHFPALPRGWLFFCVFFFCCDSEDRFYHRLQSSFFSQS